MTRPNRADPNPAFAFGRYLITLAHVDEALYVSMLTRWYVMGDVFNERPSLPQAETTWLIR